MGIETAVRVRVSGRVQGVWFRAWTERTALELGVSGWVRNAPDGTVEALIGGSADAVKQMVARLHDGPDMARVDRVVTLPAEVDEVPGGFEIRR